MQNKNSRKTDPQTSKLAELQLPNFIRGHKRQIIASVKLHGDMTVDEIAEKTRLQSQQVNKRTSDMKALGWMMPTGKTKASNSGNPERIWAVCGVAA